MLIVSFFLLISKLRNDQLDTLTSGGHFALAIYFFHTNLELATFSWVVISLLQFWRHFRNLTE
jgi:hypothetical protein